MEHWVYDNLSIVLLASLAGLDLLRKLTARFKEETPVRLRSEKSFHVHLGN